jgi:hypothetical protein
VCNATYCVSSGTYLNDNGEDLVLDKNMNQYSFSYLQSIAAPTVLTITVDHVADAVNYSNNQTNANDAMNTI